VILFRNNLSFLFQVVDYFEIEQANPFATPGFPGYHHSYELVRHQNLSPSLTACLPNMVYRAILISLVSYKSPDNVPDTFTPDVMQKLIRLHSALPFSIQAFHGHNRYCPFSTPLSLNEASVGISLYSAPFTHTLVTRWLPFSLSFTTAPVSGCCSIRWFAGYS
jgi:hypothetical protein